MMRAIIVIAVFVGVLFAAPQFSFAAAPKPNCTIKATLKQGAKGDKVKILQNFLAARYFLKASDIVTGTFGPTTQWYVVKYQQEKSIPALGVLSTTTRTAIEKDCGKRKDGTSISGSSSSKSTSNPVLWGGYTPAEDTSDDAGESGQTTYTAPNPTACPQVTIPECPNGYLTHLGFDKNYCDRGYSCVAIPQYYYMRTEGEGKGMMAAAVESTALLMHVFGFMNEVTGALIFGR